MPHSTLRSPPPSTRPSPLAENLDSYFTRASQAIEGVFRNSHLKIEKPVFIWSCPLLSPEKGSPSSEERPGPASRLRTQPTTSLGALLSSAPLHLQPLHPLRSISLALGHSPISAINNSNDTFLKKSLDLTLPSSSVIPFPFTAKCLKTQHCLYSVSLLPIRASVRSNRTSAPNSPPKRLSESHQQPPSHSVPWTLTSFPGT